MVEFDRLFELLDEAIRASECECRVTTLAYLRLATAEAYRLYERAAHAEEERKLRTAAAYIDRKTLANPSFKDAALSAERFWSGFENGWYGHTMPGRASNIWKIGRRFATHTP
jgi:hypothetical protein